MHLKVIRRLLQIPREHLVIGIRGELDNITNADVDDPKEALILLLEFLLVEHLDSQDAVFVHLEVKALIPIWVEVLFGNLCRPRLLAADGGYCEWVGLLKNIPFRKAISRDNCHAEIRLAGW